MAAVALLGGAALYLLYNSTAPPPSAGSAAGAAMASRTPSDVRHAFTGNLDTQQAYWTRRPFPPQNSGARPYAIRKPRPQLIETRVMVDDCARTQPLGRQEYQRRLIEDHESMNYPFSGDQASLWKDRERRRMPFINHPQSAYSTVRVPPESARVVPIVQPPSY